MPYIKTIANVAIPEDKREAIKAKMGEDAALLGKNEQFLMVDFCENSPLYFGGTKDPAAIVCVDLYGSAGADAYKAFCKAATELVGKALAIAPTRVFVKFAEYSHWGWNGDTF